MKNKKMQIGLICCVLTIGGYFFYSKYTSPKLETRYLLSPVEKGTLTVSVDGTGQVSASSQVDIKSEVSGRVLDLPLKSGQEVQTDALLARIDAREVSKTVRDANVNVENAKISLKKLQQGSDALTVMQAQNSLDQAKTDLEKLKITQANNIATAEEKKQSAEENLIKAYDNAFTAVSSAFLDFPGTMNSLYDILYGDDVSVVEPIFAGRNNIMALSESLSVQEDLDSIESAQIQAENSYNKAKQNFDITFAHYKQVSRSTLDNGELEQLLQDTIHTAQALSEAEKIQSTYFDTWVTLRTDQQLRIFSPVTTFQGTLNTFISESNSALNSLLSSQNALTDNKNTIANANRDLLTYARTQPIEILNQEQTIREREQNLVKIRSGADPLDLRSSELSLEQRLNTLHDAQAEFAKYTPKIPFDGTLAVLNIKKGDMISNGQILATLIAKDRIATISLNEVDIAKVKVGQKATLTFDALEGITAVGSVQEVDSIGTVSQGVVNYSVKIAFSSEEVDVKPGMSVSAAIITQVDQDVLVVSNAAIKSTQSGSSIQIITDLGTQDPGDPNGVTSALGPQAKVVQVVLSNDSQSEISGNIKEGEYVIVRTITPVATATPQKSILSSIPGASGSGSGRALGGR